jgi:dolichol-phosphate mannosyltransferase
VRTIVVVPTYQEADNVERFLKTMRTTVPDLDLLVVDDNSPDGTGALADRCAAELGQITVLHREHKQGLGSAYRAGFAAVLGQGYDVVMQMDCDFSHDPAAVANLVGRVERGADCVVGSRYVRGGATENWPLHRRLLSRWGNRYTAGVLRLSLRDVTSGFRAYRCSALAAIEPETTTAEGYAFLTELTRRLIRAGFRVEEEPITFADRTAGQSKMSSRIIRESMLLVTSWGLRDLRNAVRNKRSA